MGHERGIVGFILAGLACGDGRCERAISGLAQPLRGRAEAALVELAGLSGEARVAFLRVAGPRSRPQRPASGAAPPGLTRALSALAEPVRSDRELSLLEDSGWLG